MIASLAEVGGSNSSDTRGGEPQGEIRSLHKQVKADVVVATKAPDLSARTLTEMHKRAFVMHAKDRQDQYKKMDALEAQWKHEREVLHERIRVLEARSAVDAQKIIALERGVLEAKLLNKRLTAMEASRENNSLLHQRMGEVFADMRTMQQRLNILETGRYTDLQTAHQKIGEL